MVAHQRGLVRLLEGRFFSAMQPGEIQRLDLDRQVNLARPFLLLLVLAELLALEPARAGRGTILFLWLYLGAAVAVLLWQRLGRESVLRVPYAVDTAALGSLFLLSPSVVAFWLFYLFVSFAVAAHAGARGALLLGVVAALAVATREMWHGPAEGAGMLRSALLGAGTCIVGATSGLFGVRDRRQAVEERFLQRLVGSLQVERGLAESLHLALDQVAREFSSEEALIAAPDEELERVFIWRVRQGQKTPVTHESLPITRADAFLADDLNTALCWNSLEGAGDGFGWHRSAGFPLLELPRLPQSTRDALQARSLLVATMESATKPLARLLVVNGKRRFTPRDLRWLEEIARNIGPPLENLYLLRHLRARAVEADRSRISRDLHDGILQTLLSMQMQLEVLRRKLLQDPEQAAADLAALQGTVKQESEELRRMVTDLRPQRVESADLVELMTGFAERFRNEAGLGLDLFLEGRDLRVPDRVCRELFQIYRESLNNIKKHAQATHIVVKLWQDETKVFLVVDDNGSGFSFEGRFSSEELDRLRLGPISIKERTRSVGGTLTVESTPGHGARLTLEIPLS